MKRILLLLLALIISASATACSAPAPSASITASAGCEQYIELLKERLGADMPDDVVIAVGDDTVKYGADMSDFKDSEGYTVRAKDGKLVILGKTEASVDRAVRQFANYGNNGNYSFTYGEGYRVKSIKIAGADISEYGIMLPENNDGAHTYAAESLREYIGKACGFYPEISEYSERDGRYIRLVRVYPEDEKYAELGDEGFTVSVDDSGVTIYGGYLRGCMYGVFDFLEQDIGWRFMRDSASYRYRASSNEADIDYLYESDGIEIGSDSNRTETPSIGRRHNIYRGHCGSTEDHNIKRKTNSISYARNGYGMIDFACHGIINSGVADLLPGYDPDIYMQPCFTSENNIEIAKEHYAGIVEANLAAGKILGWNLTNLDVSQHDSGYFCQCQNCMELEALDGGHIGPVLYFANEIARHIGDLYGYDSGLKISMFAYFGTTMVPKVTRPERNINVSFCYYNDIGYYECRHHGIDGEDCDPVKTKASTFEGMVGNDQYAERIRGWSEIAETLTVWYYPGYWCDGCFTLPMLTNLCDDMKFLADLGIDGIYVCCSGYEMADEKIISYLLSNLMWDADISEEEYRLMIEEYYRILYGDGYEYILEHIERVENYVSDECWSCSVFSSTADRIDFGAVTSGFLYDIELYKRAAALAATEEQQKLIEGHSLSMYFTGLAAAYDLWYVNGTEEKRAEYEAIWDEFTALATDQNYEFQISFQYSDTPSTKINDHIENLAEPCDLIEYFGFDMTQINS